MSDKIRAIQLIVPVMTHFRVFGLAQKSTLLFLFFSFVFLFLFSVNHISPSSHCPHTWTSLFLRCVLSTRLVCKCIIVRSFNFLLPPFISMWIFLLTSVRYADWLGPHLLANILLAKILKIKIYIIITHAQSLSKLLISYLDRYTNFHLNRSLNWYDWCPYNISRVLP